MLSVVGPAPGKVKPEEKPLETPKLPAGIGNVHGTLTFDRIAFCKKTRHSLIYEVNPHMNCVSLILSFKSPADQRLQVRSASRIQLAGKGEILLYDENGSLDRLHLGEIQALQIHSLSSYRAVAPQA